MNDLLQELAAIRGTDPTQAVDRLCDIIASLAAKVQELEDRLDWKDDCEAGFADKPNPTSP